MAAQKREPIFGAAVLKLSFRMRGDEASEGFRRVYEGVLRDLGVTDDEVERYLAEHRAEVEQAARGQRK
ncbi:hypothetical protein [Vulgatibacter sp.]|uniref:hypothetical protein n=1 Tax=Vulgatibacter sp. TaxID=1971226 RepID=UPI0035619F78